MNLAEQAAAIMGRCTHYNMITGEGFVARRFMGHQRGAHPYVLAQGPEGTLIMRKLDGEGRVIRQRVGYPDGSSLLYSCEYGMSPVVTTNDRKPDEPRPCTLGVGCDETGVCYAEAHGQPEQCGRNQT